MKKTNNVPLFAVAIIFLAVMVINIAVNPFKEAYAIQYTSYTTTGTQTNDNCVVGEDNSSDIWLLCNASPTGSNSVLSVTSASGTQHATLATTITFETANTLLPLYGVSDSRNILLYSRSGFIKYNFDGASAITQIGSFTPSSCTNTLNGVATYDSIGNVWYPCPTQNTVQAMNPTTMTNIFTSGTLSLHNGGSDTASNCLNSEGDTQVIYPITGHAIGFTKCTNPQLVYMFNMTFNKSANSYAMSATGIGGYQSVSMDGNLPDLYLDPLAKRFVTQSTSAGLGLQTTKYTLSANNQTVASFSAELNHFGSAVNSYCASDFYLGSNRGHVIFCASNSQIQGFFSNSTGSFVSTINIGSYSTTYNIGIRPITTYLASNFVVTTGALDAGTQNFLYITDIGTVYGNVESTPPPNNNVTSSGTANTCHSTNTTTLCVGDVNCNLAKNFYILMCVNARGPQPLASASETVGNSTNFIFSQVGLVPAGSNIKTNGVGYAMVAVTEGILISMFFLATKGDIKQIPNFVWVIGTLAVLGACTAFGFVDVTFFLIGILVIIALASAKILSTLELGGFR